jgi:hypothetical protein
MNENIKYIAAGAAVVVASIGAVLYITQRKPKAPKPPEPVPVTAPAPVAETEEPAIKHPVATPPEPEPLPSLEQSDQPLFSALEGVIGQLPAQQYIVPQELVRHIVVTIDNLPNEKAAERVRPLKAAPGKFAASGPEDALTLDPANYERYKPLVQVFRSIDNQQLVALYSRYYPLFQDVYESQGHPPQYFNDRLIEVIDHLLATPDPQGPIRLVRPNVQYEYADPQLESLSAGQKTLLRMGSANASAVKEKLRSLRATLAAQPKN